MGNVFFGWGRETASNLFAVRILGRGFWSGGGGGGGLVAGESVEERHSSAAIPPSAPLPAALAETKGRRRSNKRRAICECSVVGFSLKFRVGQSKRLVIHHDSENAESDWEMLIDGSEKADLGNFIKPLANCSTQPLTEALTRCST